MKIAFVSPRLHEPGTVGGAETLLYSLAQDAVRLGYQVEFLCTCARNHFTWENELPEGVFERDGMTVRRFPVDPRNVELFMRHQIALSNGAVLSVEEQLAWLRNSVRSTPLVEQLRKGGYDRVVAGPYLFGLIWYAALAVPDRLLLVSCFHDEPFAKVPELQKAFLKIRGFLFNTEPERRLAHRLMPTLAPRVESVVAMGLEPFEIDKECFAKRKGWDFPYVLYSGRREGLKGTPILVDYMDTFRKRTKRDVHLVMTGSGQVDVPDSLRPAFHDLGFVSEQEKREAMGGAMAFIHPSVNESLSIVILEAWLARTPALVHAKGEVLRWQCESSNGGLWFSEYPEFEEELLLYLDHPEVCRILGEQGRRYAIERYAPDAVRNRLDLALRAE